MAKISGFHHTAIRSVDFEKSLKFYAEGLGLAVKITWGEAPERGVLFDAGDGNYVEIFERAPVEIGEESSILHFAFRTDDCAAMLEKARAADAEVTVETKDVVIPSNIGPVPIKIAFFKGPDGEVIELFENALL